MTYSNMRELRAYASRSGGAIQELTAAQLVAPLPLDEAVRATANRIGIGVRQSEMLRDLRQDAYAGRVYLPQDRLTAHNVTLEDMRGREVAPRLKAALREFKDAVNEELRSALASATAPLRPLAVLERCTVVCSIESLRRTSTLRRRASSSARSRSPGSRGGRRGNSHEVPGHRIASAQRLRRTAGHRSRAPAIGLRLWPRHSSPPTPDRVCWSMLPTATSTGSTDASRPSRSCCALTVTASRVPTNRYRRSC